MGREMVIIWIAVKIKKGVSYQVARERTKGRRMGWLGDLKRKARARAVDSRQMAKRIRAVHWIRRQVPAKKNRQIGINLMVKRKETLIRLRIERAVRMAA
jgi:hypothetical protein